jgi:hypothetical protein
VLLLAACGGVGYRVDATRPAPATVAVLPFEGDAPQGLRDAARQLLHSRLAGRGYRVPELAWVDRVLSEHGWLRDPAAFAVDASALADVVRALDVDAVLVGTGFAESSFNVLLLRRHAVSGELAIRDAGGAPWWSSDHGTSTLGGLLLTSGQVFAEIRAQGEHGTPMASLALADELVADVAGTIPVRELVPLAGAPPTVADVDARRVAQPDGSERLVVQARASADCVVRCELQPHVRGVPMVALPGDSARYRGEHDVPRGTAVQRVVVRARDAFGRETTAEVAL